MVKLYRLYTTIDIYKYGDAGDFKYFPPHRERTVEKFLNSFSTIYHILQRLAGIAISGEAFDNFWDKCRKYLSLLNYDSPEFMEKDSDFYRASTRFWKREYGGDDSGLEGMYSMFKTCFGIVGNDELCRYERAGVTSYSWSRMRKCLAAASEVFEETKVPDYDPADYQWSEASASRLREKIEQIKKEEG